MAVALVSRAQSWVSSLLVHGGDLIALGQFDQAGGLPVENAAAWIGKEWRALGELPTTARGAAVVDDQIIVGGFGWFQGVDAVFTWDGADWYPLEGGPESHIQFMPTQIPGVIGFNSDLFVGGGFTHVGKTPTAFVARAACQADGACLRQPRLPGRAPLLRLLPGGEPEVTDESGATRSAGRLMMPGTGF